MKARVVTSGLQIHGGKNKSAKVRVRSPGIEPGSQRHSETDAFGWQRRVLPLYYDRTVMKGNLVIADMCNGRIQAPF
jgi:hypothetical protein